MKQKQLSIRFFFALLLLGSLVVQSFHGYEHLKKQLSEKVCLHKHANSAELTHQHKSPEPCFVCSFSFGNVLIPDSFPCQFRATYPVAKANFFAFAPVIFFSGSSYTLRGPPQSIV